MAADDTYEGWTNRETWATNLWIQNSHRTHALAQGLVQDVIEQACESWSTSCEYLAEMLQENFELGDNELDGLRLDLFHCALAHINWYEIAAEMIAERRAADR